MAPEGVSTCRSRSAKGEWVEKVFDYVIACSSLKGRISDMQVIEDFESRPHKAVTFVVERRKAGMERAKKCRRRCLDTAEEDYQEEARERKVGKKKEEKKKNKDWEK